MEELDIVVSGYAGEIGASYAARMFPEKWSKCFRPEYAARLLSCVEPKFYKNTDIRERILSCGAEEIIEVSEGGIWAALYEMARKKKCGFRIFLSEIPLRAETVEICEALRLNPYRLYSDCLLVLSRSGMRMEKRLHEMQIPSACAGFLTRDPQKQVIGKEEIEYLNRPEADALRKLFPDANFQEKISCAKKS